MLRQQIPAVGASLPIVHSRRPRCRVEKEVRGRQVVMRLAIELQI